MLSKYVERIEDKMILLYDLIEDVVQDTPGTPLEMEGWHKDLETVKFFVLHAPTHRNSMEVCNRLWLKYMEIAGPEMVSERVRFPHYNQHRLK